MKKIISICIGILCILLLVLQYYLYTEGNRYQSLDTKYRDRIVEVTKDIENLETDLSKPVEEKLLNETESFQSMVDILSRVSSSQESLLNNLNNDFVKSEQVLALKNIVSNLKINDPLFVLVDTPASYKVKFGYQSQYKSDETLIPIAYQYFANDELVYVVTGYFNKYDRKVSIDNIFTTSNTYKFYRTNAFGEVSKVYSESDIVKDATGAGSTRYLKKEGAE